jgi:hypothetical protein
MAFSQPEDFGSTREYWTDHESHLQHVREMFENLDVLVFTLGLTECWRSREDGAVFPMCPGVLGGTFDKRRHEFLNLGVEDVVSDMTSFIAELRAINPEARVILTVSPVPLIATAEPRHGSSRLLHLNPSCGSHARRSSGHARTSFTSPHTKSSPAGLAKHRISPRIVAP